MAAAVSAPAGGGAAAAIATRHAVIIPSIRRPGCLRETVGSVLRQEPPPDVVVLAVVSDEDVDAALAGEPRVKIIKARKGSSCQRNDAVAALPAGIDYVTFLDDDVELAADYLVRVRELLAADASISVASGNLLANGNIDRAGALATIRSVGFESPDCGVAAVASAYGCNMTVRRKLLDELKFDERLRGYGWLEDYEFGLRCGRIGRCVEFAGSRAVHLMVSSGRVSGLKFGFSQIMNPHYLRKKGLMSRWEVLRQHWLAAVCGNLVKWILRDKQVDRGGRLKGNLIALSLAARGRCEPEYVENL